MLHPGSVIGGLAIGDLLGRGAMGEVYRAEQLSLKRPVAVKRIAEHLIDEEAVVTRFEREAQCIARVNSPNVLGVYEFGRFTDDQGNGHWLLVMELVEGGCNARELLRRGMDWRQATSIIMQVAEGLAAAAEHDIVHRDIKPDNIMVNAKGVAKLADFGLAKAADSHGMTMEGALVGTPYYMPPEACRGDPIDHQGDLYSLGATWYHLLSGRPVFQDRNTMMLLRAHAEQEPEPLSRLAAQVPASLAALVHQCLAKEAKDRPPSAEHLVRLLQALVAEGIHIPRTVPELLPEVVGVDGRSFGSTMKTAIAGPRALTNARTLAASSASPSADANSSDDHGRWSTLAAEVAGPERHVAGKRAPLLLAAIVVGVLGKLVISGIIWMTTKGAVTPDREQLVVSQGASEGSASASSSNEGIHQNTGQNASSNNSVNNSVRGDGASAIADSEGNAAASDQAEQKLEGAEALAVVDRQTGSPLAERHAAAIDLGLEQSAQELASGAIVESWAWLEQIPNQVSQDSQRSQRLETLKSEVISKARAMSSETLGESMRLMQAGELQQALRILQRDRRIAHIAGAGERYEEVIGRLQSALQDASAGE